MPSPSPTPLPAARCIRDLPPNANLGVVRFRYPGDGQLYYWVSQWSKGVWGRKVLGSSEVFPLQCHLTVQEALDWEVVEALS